MISITGLQDDERKEGVHSNALSALSTAKDVIHHLEKIIERSPYFMDSPYVLADISAGDQALRELVCIYKTLLRHLAECQEKKND